MTLKSILQFRDNYNNHDSGILKEEYNEILSDSTCFVITKDNPQKNEIDERKNISNIIVIGETSESDDSYIIICFDNTIILVSKKDLSLVQFLVDKYKNSTVFLLSEKIKCFFEDFKNITFIKFSFPKISNFIKPVFQKKWDPIIKCIFSFLAERCYLNNYNSNRIQNYEFKTENTFIPVENMACLIPYMSSVSKLYLIYDFENDEINIIKIFPEDSLFNREYENYKNLNHPLIPKCYGYSKINKVNGLILEYIRGQALKDINKMKLTDDEKLKIIFEIMILIEYLHNSHYIYRDLKPENLILDKNKTIVLLDFDRLIKEDVIDSSNTQDLNLASEVPEFNGKFSYPLDIYLLGLLIHFIICEKEPKKNEQTRYPIFDEFPKKYSDLKSICLRCVNADPSKRPIISELIDFFYTTYFSKIPEQISELNTIQLIKNIHENQFNDFWVCVAEYDNYYAQGKLANIYDEGKIFNKNVYKTDLYRKRASKLSIEQISDQNLQKMYSVFDIKHINEDSFDIKSSLERSKFITFSISEHQNQTNQSSSINDEIYGNVVICSEGLCLILSSANINNIASILKETNAFLIDASEGDFIFGQTQKHEEINTEIDNFCNYYQHEIQNNLFIETTIRSVAAFLIRRYFCPSNYFKDQSFFEFGPKEENPLSRDSLNQRIFSQSDYEISKSNIRSLYTPILTRQIEVLSNMIPFHNQTFRERDFILLRKLHSNQEATYELVIHIQSGYIFMLKKLENKNITIDKQSFEKVSSNDSFIKFYGFLEDENKRITGLVYEYMSNGKFLNYITNKETKITRIRSLILLLRFYFGFNHLQEYYPDHRSIEVSNVFLDHNNIPYISYSFLPNNEKQQTNSNSSYINSFGEFIYLIYSKKEIPESSQDIPEIAKCSANFQELFNLCISHVPGDKFSFDKIEDFIFNELENLHFIEYYISESQEQIAQNELIDVTYELIRFLIYMKRIDTFAASVLDIFYIPFLLFYKMKDDMAELNYQIGLIYENGFKGRHCYEKAKYYYSLAEKENHSKSLFHLGHLYQYGNGVKQDYKKAREYYELAAKQNNLFALLHLGMFYENGIDVAQSTPKAKEYFMRAVNSKNSDVPLQIGDLYYAGSKVRRNFSKAKEYYEISAKKGNPKALFKLGNMYERGVQEERINKDYFKAKELYEKAGNLKNSESLVRIGDFYYYGNHFKQSYSDARKYYEQAEQLGNARAVFQLGFMHKEGLGVIADEYKANHYFRRYLELQSNILLQLGLFYENGYGVKKNYNKVKEYFELANELNNLNSCFHLGVLYKCGKGVKKDDSKSEEYFKKFAESGKEYKINLLERDFQNPSNHYNSPQEYFSLYAAKNSDALLKIGILYEKGQGLQRDILKAKQFYKLSSGFKNSNAYYRIGRLYEKGNETIKQDYNKAKDYYQVSIEQNNYKAYYRLGNIFEKGLAGVQDYSAALKFFELSANPNSLKSYYRIGLMYLNGKGVVVNINKAISNFNICIKLFNELKTRYLEMKYRIYCALSMNYLGIIYATNGDLDKNKAENYFNQAHIDLLILSINNLGLFYQFSSDQSKKGNAQYLYEDAANKGFAMAAYNLGYMNEMEGKIKDAVDLYCQASENENNPIMFKEKQIDDEYIQLSKTFIICLTNLKLTKYYLSTYQSSKAKAYFRRAFKKLISKNYQFNMQINANDKNNIFSYIKKFIFDFPDFHITSYNKVIAPPGKAKAKNINRKLFVPGNYQSKMTETQLKKEQNRAIDKILYSKMSSVESDAVSLVHEPSQIEDAIINNPEDLFEYALKNDFVKGMFISEINEIIEEMISILYKPPYRILFGRMNCNLELKQRPVKNPRFRKDTNQLFMQGFDENTK